MMRRLVSLLLVFGVSAGICWAGPCRGISTLRGIQSVRVTVEPLDGDAAALNIKESAIKTFVKQRLKRKAGLTVVDEPRMADRGSFLYVNIVAVPLPKDDRSTAHPLVEIELSFVQLVQIPEIETTTLAHTWVDNSWLQIVHDDKAHQSSMDHLEEMVDEFIIDYLSVNPPKSEPPT